MATTNAAKPSRKANGRRKAAQPSHPAQPNGTSPAAPAPATLTDGQAEHDRYTARMENVLSNLAYITHTCAECGTAELARATAAVADIALTNNINDPTYDGTDLDMIEPLLEVLVNAANWYEVAYAH